ncbi:fructosamine kinase family protein [Mycobacterium attenuatum]|uniref:fructosamine kinase family protein n=1 Tax=Mycobacterium attenuatum TaxID=2341086 RepID=UPI000F1161EC|nr:fructosamine kinase family protein [Mycobacterium attenuatum]VBA47925.1 hypothetical protein LAUMK41_00641 [Mycobacterium attenuatum]
MPDANELRKHLAYEVHYLVLAAVRFTEVSGRDGAFYQDSALIHARNLLEFTKPAPAPRFGWWIANVGGRTPQAESTHDDWVEFINSNVSHLGERRLQDLQWPIPKDDQRLINIARYLLQRLNSLANNSSDPCAVVMEKLAQLGLTYLTDPNENNLAKIAQAIDAPLEG